MKFTRTSIAATAVLLASLAIQTFTGNNLGAQGCHKDCGYYTNQELRDSGLYLGPATSNAHDGNVYEY